MRHLMSGRWLTANPHRTSATESSNMAVELSTELNKRVLFRLLPRSKARDPQVKSEGEPISLGDHITLESVKTGSYVHTSTPLIGSVKSVMNDWFAPPADQSPCCTATRSTNRCAPRATRSIGSPSRGQRVPTPTTCAAVSYFTFREFFYS